MKIEKSEIRSPKSSEQKTLEELKKDIREQSGDQKLFIKHLNDLLPSLQFAFENLPKEVLKAFATKLEFSLKQTVRLDDGSKIEITNLEALAKAVNILSQEFKAWKSKDTITIKNIEKIKPDLTELEKTISKFEDLIREYIKKDINVVVNNPDNVFIRNWPKKPTEAIPVVLVDKELKRFYNAVASFIGGGGASFTQGPIKFKVGDSEQVVDATHPLPVTSSGVGAEFSRIKNKNFEDDEEVRYDIPVILANGDIYTAVAPDGTLTNFAGWTIIRTYFDANSKPSRERIRFNVAWDTRTVGW